MRHRVARRKLNRTKEHRRALRRNMAQSLFEHGQIKTTLAKAKDLRPWAEKMITLARKAHQGNLAARQRLMSLLGDRAIIPEEFYEEYEDMSAAARNRVLRYRSGRRHRMGEAKAGMKFTALSVVHHLVNNIAPRYEDRPGGYTRVIRLGEPNKGNNAEMAVLQLVGEEESPGTVTRPERTARQRRTERRYAAAAKSAKMQAAARKEKATSKAEAPVDEAPPESEAEAGQGDSKESQE
jgi:large subunit ribosomal protein L17